MDPGVAAGAAVAVWCPMADGTTPVPGLPGLATSFSQGKGKTPLQWCCHPLGRWQLPGKPPVPPTTARKMCLLHWEQVLNQG